MSGALTLTTSLLAALGVWLLGMRPYLQRHGVTVVTGAALWLGAWADWQQCREFARAMHDSRAAVWSRLFLLTQMGFVLGALLMICGI
jgi:hypothetical protein